MQLPRKAHCISFNNQLLLILFPFTSDSRAVLVAEETQDPGSDRLVVWGSKPLCDYGSCGQRYLLGSTEGVMRSHFIQVLGACFPLAYIGEVLLAWFQSRMGSERRDIFGRFRSLPCGAHSHW